MSETLRIALISEHDSPLATSHAGVGQRVYVTRLAQCLARAGHQVDVLSPGEHPAGLRQGEPYDVVHANFFTAGPMAQQLKRAQGTPFVMSFHGLGLAGRDAPWPPEEVGSERAAIERQLVREADAIVCCCAQDSADLVRHHGAEAARVSVVPCGVDAATFSPFDKAAARDRLGLAPEAFVVLQLERPHPRTHTDPLALALARLRRDIPARLLRVDGATCERDTLPLHYAAADVFVAAPRHDPFGITALESMACGTPVLGSAVGAIRHVVRDGETGFLVPPDDPAALAARLAQLHDDPALARAMGRAGVRRTRAMFSWERAAHQLVDVYHGVRCGPVADDALPAWRHLQLVRPGQALLPAGFR